MFCAMLQASGFGFQLSCWGLSPPKRSVTCCVTWLMRRSQLAVSIVTLPPGPYCAL